MDIMDRRGLRAVSLSERGPGITDMAMGTAACMAIAAGIMDTPAMGMDDLVMATDDLAMGPATEGRAWLEADSAAAEFTATSAEEASTAVVAEASMAAVVATAVVDTGKVFPSAV